MSRYVWGIRCLDMPWFVSLGYATLRCATVRFVALRLGYVRLDYDMLGHTTAFDVTLCYVRPGYARRDKVRCWCMLGADLGMG